MFVVIININLSWVAVAAASTPAAAQKQVYAAIQSSVSVASYTS
jgi:hypothetical protein